jgi:hypothetical protein
MFSSITCTITLLMSKIGFDSNEFECNYLELFYDSLSSGRIDKSVFFSAVHCSFGIGIDSRQIEIKVRLKDYTLP